MIAAILFDKDGTLYDFYRTWGALTEQAALFVIFDLGYAGDRIRQLAVGKDAQIPRLLGDKQAAIREVCHGPAIVELGQALDIRLSLRERKALGMGWFTDHRRATGERQR